MGFSAPTLVDQPIRPSVDPSTKSLPCHNLQRLPSGAFGSPRLPSVGVAAAITADLLARPSVAQDVLHAEIPPDIAATQAATGWYCDQENRQLFRFSAAVTGGPGKVSRTEAVCR